MKLHLDLHISSLVNRETSKKLGLKLTQDPLKYATFPKADPRPGKIQQSGGKPHLLEAKIGQETTLTISTIKTEFFKEV